MKVLQSVQRWLPLTQTWLYDQVRFLPPPVASTVVADDLRNGSAFPWSDVRVPRALPQALHRLARPGFHEARRHRLMQRTLNAVKPAVVHSHFGDQAWRDHALVRGARVAQVVTFYGHDVNRLPGLPGWRDRYRDLFGAANLVLAEGPFMAKSLGDLGAKRVAVHPLGVDTADPVYQTRPVPSPTGRAGPLRILMVAGFREKKGIPDGLQAISQLDGDVQVTIIGDDDGTAPSLDEKRRIMATLDATHLRPQTRLLGFRSRRDVLRELARADVLLAPSRTAFDGDSEGGAPVILLQAMAMGVPIVSSHHCDIPFVLANGANGQLAKPGQIAHFTAALAAVRDDPEERAAEVAAAQADVAVRFDARKQATSLAERYRGVAFA